MSAGVGGEPLLIGPASVDRWLSEGRTLPGGGALNMAYHWSRTGVRFRLLTRIGRETAGVFTSFFDRHGIATTDGLLVDGPSASIDVVIGDDRQPHMDNFVEGAWAGFRLTAAEEGLLAAGRRAHVVLVAASTTEVLRLGAAGALDDVDLSADFLSFRRWTPASFDAAMAHVRTGFVGWPGDPDDPLVQAIRAVAFERRRLVVVTLGEHGVRVFDGRDGRTVDRFVPVVSVPVEGTTIGCGDSFIAAFLAAVWAGRSLHDALDDARAAGAEATRWLLPLPTDAYGSVPLDPKG